MGKARTDPGGCFLTFTLEPWHLCPPPHRYTPLYVLSLSSSLSVSLTHTYRDVLKSINLDTCVSSYPPLPLATQIPVSLVAFSTTWRLLLNNYFLSIVHLISECNTGTPGLFILISLLRYFSKSTNSLSFPKTSAWAVENYFNWLIVISYIHRVLYNLCIFNMKWKIQGNWHFFLKHASFLGAREIA